MTLKENSKAIKISLILIGIAIAVLLFQYISGIVNVIKYTSGAHYLLSYVIWLIPIGYLIYIAMQLYLNNSNVERILTCFSYYLIVYPISLVLSNLSTIIMLGERLFPLQIILTTIEVIFLFLPAILGINIVKNSGSTQFLKTVSIVEIIFFAISTILVIPRAFIRGPLFASGITALPLLLFYIALFIISKDVEEVEKAVSISDLEEENITKNVLLSIITFGVYGYIWLYRMSKNIKCFKNDQSSLTGELLCLLFVPFYMLYWIYTREKAIKFQADSRSLQISDNAALYLVLSLLGLSIVSIALMQNDLNTVIRNKEKPIIREKADNNFGQGKNNVEILKQLAQLKENGILTEEEYQKKKQEVLDRI